MIDRRLIGHSFPEVTVDIHRDWLKQFAEGVGETDPIYLDVSAARRAGHPDLPAPPTFLFNAELDGLGLDTLLSLLGLHPSQITHREQDFCYHGVLHAGDRVRMRSTITDIYRREEDALEFLVRECLVLNQNEQRIADLRSVFAVSGP